MSCKLFTKLAGLAHGKRGRGASLVGSIAARKLTAVPILAPNRQPLNYCIEEAALEQAVETYEGDKPAAARLACSWTVAEARWAPMSLLARRHRSSAGASSGAQKGRDASWMCAASASARTRLG